MTMGRTDMRKNLAPIIREESELCYQLADCTFSTQLLERCDLSGFDHFEQGLCCEDGICKRAMAGRRHREVEPAGHDVETVAELAWVESLAQLHRAAALRKIDVAPAILLLFEQKPHVELRVVCEKERPASEFQKLRK